MAEGQGSNLTISSSGSDVPDSDKMDASNVWIRNDADIIFYLDCVAANTGAKVSRNIAYALGIDGPTIGNIEKDQPNAHETSFRILYTWFNKTDRGDLENNFKHAFEEVERKDVLEMSFSRYDFTYKEDVGIEKITDADVLFVSKQGPPFQRMTRFLGAGEDKIETELNDNPMNVKEQAYQVLLACKNAGKMKFRKELCDALSYTDNSKLIRDLKNYWGRDNMSLR